MCLKFNFIIITGVIQTVCGLICSRYPANTFTPKSPVDENFVISITGNPQTYILGQEYNISLNAFNGLRFISFGLSLENENGDSGYADDLGHFEIVDNVETRYSPNCINMVENTNTNSKTRIDVGWIAPTEPGTGCILIRAMVLQHRDVWYMDDGGLTRRICEEVVDDVESQKTIRPRAPCCACDEAKYEITFEGTWSRNLHPKDFPSKGWITRFSDIIGAAHTWDYRFWQYGALASEGMREFGEHGSTRLLEREFNMNFKNGNIRTIIKARGPAFPNLNGHSIASVRVDPVHHMISLATKIEPSPDWIVGMSGLELCMSNCTWLESKVINLYPWDIGTDAGPSYISADQPQVPPDVIRRMRSDYPNDPRSPFFEETGAPMKPLATLTVRRRRLYERLCEVKESNNIDVPRECFTHPWNHWTECTAKCGEGHQMRTRVYKQPEVAKIYNCDVITVMRQDRPCMGQKCGGTEQLYSNAEGPPMGEYLGEGIDEQFVGAYDGRTTQAECELSSWGAWSSCNQTCGEGKMMRRRHYINHMVEEKCQNSRFINLLQYKNCVGRSCLGDVQPHPGRHFLTKQRSSYNGVEELENVDTQNQFYDNNQNWQRFDGNDEAALNGNQEAPPYENNYGQLANNYNGLEPSFESNFEVSNLRKPANKKPESARLTASYAVSNNYESAADMQSEFPKQKLQSAWEKAAETQDLQVPAYCFQPLQFFNCLDTKVTGNYWFYNYCTDECMLFAADTCDKNDNKFSSLEMCELRCRHGVSERYRRRRQQQDCQAVTMTGARGNSRRRKGSKRSRQ